MKFINIPWGAWYGDEVKKLPFPDKAEISMIEIPYRSPLEEETYKKKLKELPSLLKKKNCTKIIIVVDDLTRPVKLETLMNVLLTMLEVKTIFPAVPAATIFLAAACATRNAPLRFKPMILSQSPAE